MSDDRDRLKQEFAAMVDVLRIKTLPHEQAIATGENPFKIWREHNGYGKDDVADILGMDVLDYIDIENDFGNAESEDIIGFCRYFELHPYDLMGDAGQAMSVAMTEALITVYDEPEALPIDRVQSKKLAQRLLVDEATTGYYSLSHMRESLNFHYPRHQGLTVDFIDAVLEKDGKLNIKPDGLNLYEQGQWIWQLADDDRHNARIRHDRFKSAWQKHGKDYNLFGRYLFRDDWPKISKSMSQMFRFAGVDNLMENYLGDPKFIGRASWPEPVSGVFINQQAYSWRSAQQRHWQHAESMFLSFEEKQKQGNLADTLEFQCNLFDEWLERNKENLWRFENRQIIMRHADFAYLADTSPKKLLEYKPEKPQSPKLN